MYQAFLYSVVFLFVANSTKYANVQVEQQSGLSNITPKAYYLIDASGQLTAEKLADGQAAEQWQQVSGKSVNFGSSSDIIWFRISLTSEQASERILQNIFPYHEKFEFWYKTGNGWQSSLQGLSQAENPLLHNYPAVRLALSANSAQEIYVKTQSSRGMLFAFELLDNDRFEQEKTVSSVIYGIYFGLLAAMLLYNLFVFVSLRDISFLFYVISIFCTLITFGTVSGYMRLLDFLPVASRTWLLALAMTCIPIFTSLFTMYFLETKKYAAIFHQLLLVSIGFATFSFLWFMFLGSARFINIAISVHTILMLATGLYVWRKGQKAARFFVLAWSLYLIFGLSITLRNIGLVEAGSFVNHGAEFASAFEVILLGIALSDRYRLYKKQEEEAQKELIEMQQNANQKLEHQVAERTVKLREANEELSQINEELKLTLDLVNDQKLEIEDKNKSILDSITYAQRIQQSILPDQTQLSNVFTDHFLFFRPLHVVSGDFYFYTQQDGKDILGVLDCTGHGVPGAFMSLIGYNVLQQVIKEHKQTDPGIILTEVNQQIQALLNRQAGGGADGMDAVLCAFDQANRELKFAGAMSSLLIKQPGQPIERLRGDRAPIGGSLKYFKDITFSTKNFSLQKDCMVYLTTDGFQDQFGGPDNQKFKSKKFRELLETLADLPSDEQNAAIASAHNQWKGNTKQTDDVLVIGVRVG